MGERQVGSHSFDQVVGIACDQYWQNSHAAMLKEVGREESPRDGLVDKGRNAVEGKSRATYDLCSAESVQKRVTSQETSKPVRYEGCVDDLVSSSH